MHHSPPFRVLLELELELELVLVQVQVPVVRMATWPPLDGMPDRLPAWRHISRFLIALAWCQCDRLHTKCIRPS